MTFWHASEDHESEDHLYLLTLCLELQLDLLLVALRPDGAPRWDGDVLDLTGGAPVAGGAGPASDQRRDWLSIRYAALADAIKEMLDNPEVRRHPAVVARLVEARTTCDDRLTTRPLEPATVGGGHPGPLGAFDGHDTGRARIAAGHFLG